MTAQDYTLQDYVQDLRQIVSETRNESEILTRVSPLAQRLAIGKSWLEPQHYETNDDQGFRPFLLHEEPDHSLAVLAINWLPGRGAPAHDHGTWAVVAGVEGKEKNTSYRRIDDRSRPDYAELEVRKETIAGPGELVCMKTGGIHAVQNVTDGITISLHTYGRHINHTGRSQFDLESNRRTEFEVQVD